MNDTERFSLFGRIKKENATVSENMFILAYCMAGYPAAARIGHSAGLDCEALLEHIRASV